jgi:hypothetical protein
VLFVLHEVVSVPVHAAVVTPFEGLACELPGGTEKNCDMP